MKPPFDSLLAERLSHQLGRSLPPEAVWSICRSLEQEQALRGEASQLATISIGPYHMAVPSEQQPLLGELAIDILPNVASIVFGANVPTQLVVSGLSFVAGRFWNLYRDGVIIKDPFTWATLIGIKKLNAEGRTPTIEELSDYMIVSFPGVTVSDNLLENLRRVIDNLKQSTSIVSRTVRLLEETADGRLLTTV